MNKTNRVINKNLKLVLEIVLVIVLTFATTIGASTLFQSNEVIYDNTNSGLSSTNVKDALDKLYTKANATNHYDLGTPIYYAFGNYKGWCSSTDSECNTLSDFPTTDTTPPEGRNVYAAKYADSQYGICINRGGKEYCFRGRNYIIEAKHLQSVFSDISCREFENGVTCDATDFSCTILSKGYTGCLEIESNDHCYINDYGSIKCFG